MTSIPLYLLKIMLTIGSGTPDLKRDRSLLPESFKLYHSRFVEEKENLENEDMPIDSEPLVLPMRLKGCYWNGERWCGTPFLPRLASARNGFEFLHEKIKKSHRHLIACRMGKYFMKSMMHPEGKTVTKNTKVKSCSIRPPTIPKLNLKAVADFEYSKQLAKNAALIFAYRVEAKRIASARPATVTARLCTSDGMTDIQTSFPKDMNTERPYSTVPPKAVADASLRQLSNILDKETRFIAVQENLNKNLQQISKAIDSVRPFSYTYQFTSLKNLSPAQKSWDNRITACPRRIETFRMNLECHKWYEELVDMMFKGNRCPSKSELDILAQISHALERGSHFNSDKYIKLLKYLQRKGTDLNDSATSQALIHVRHALKVSDKALSEGFLCNCTVIPAFLSSIVVPKNYSRLSSRLSAGSHV